MEISIKLKKLVNRNRKLARLSLIGLSAVFCLSVTLFFSADILLERLQVDEISEHLEQLRQEFETIRNRRIAAMEKLTQDETALFEARKNLDEFEVEETGLIEQANKSKQKMSEIEKDYESVNRKIAEFERLRTDNIKAKSGKSLGSNLASLVTRLGAVTLAIFMMQILLSFYRFYVKVANHYEEQLILAENAKDPKSLESIISSISTAHINFGKEPEYPISKLAELSKFIK